MNKKLKSIFTNVVFWLAVTFLVIVVVARIANGQGTGSGNTPTKIERNGSSVEVDTSSNIKLNLRTGHAVDMGNTCAGATVSASGRVRFCFNGTEMLVSKSGAAFVVWTPPASGAGTVQSVNVTVPSFMTASGVPINTTGTAALSFNTQTANKVLRSGDAGGVPSFGALSAADLPAHSTALLTSGTLPPTRGGTGLVPPFALFDIPFADTTTTWGRLTANTTSTRKFFFTEGNNTIANNGGYAVLLSSDVPPVSFATNANGGIAAGTVLGVANGGTGLSALGSAEKFLRVKADGSGLTYGSLTAGTSIQLVQVGENLQINAAIDTNTNLHVSTLLTDGVANTGGVLSINTAAGTNDPSLTVGFSGFSPEAIVTANNFIPLGGGHLHPFEITRTGVYRAFGDYTDDSNYTRGSFSASSTAVTLAGESAGTGSANINVVLAPKGTGKVMAASVIESTSGGFKFPDTTVQTTAFVDDGVKQYTALLTQGGTSDPTITVLKNTLGGVPTITRVGEGSYTLTLTGAFPDANKVVIYTGNPSTSPLEAFKASWGTVNALNLNTVRVSIDFGGQEVLEDNTDSMLSKTPVTILVYP